MTAELLQGRDLASQIREISRAEIETLGYRPKVVAIHNQDNPACGVYMRMQKNLFRKSGVEYEVVSIGEHTPEKEVRSLLATLNEDPTVQGITMHVPFPDGYDSDALSQLILPGKDIEGVHPHNIGMIAYGEHNPTPCAARAAVEIARTAHSSLAGMETCVVGHGTLVGKPIAFLLLQEKRTAPTPTICHVATKDLAFHTKRADLLFVAVGKASLIHKEMVKPGATVIDIGINKGEDGNIVGDVSPDVAEVAGKITPVPGGVGPVTLAILLKNVVACARVLPVNQR